jgi:hypothetical protein
MTAPKVCVAPPSSVKAPLATDAMPLPAKYAIKIRLTTQTSTPSKKPVVRSMIAPTRVATSPPMNKAINSCKAPQIMAPVPKAPGSVLPGSMAVTPMARPSAANNMLTPMATNTPANTPPQETFIPSVPNHAVAAKRCSWCP